MHFTSPLIDKLLIASIVGLTCFLIYKEQIGLENDRLTKYTKNGVIIALMSLCSVYFSLTRAPGDSLIPTSSSLNSQGFGTVPPRSKEGFWTRQTTGGQGVVEVPQSTPTTTP